MSLSFRCTLLLVQTPMWSFTLSFFPLERAFWELVYQGWVFREVFLSLIDME